MYEVLYKVLVISTGFIFPLGVCVLAGNLYIKLVIINLVTITKQEIYGTIKTDSKELETMTGKRVSCGDKNT